MTAAVNRRAKFARRSTDGGYAVIEPQAILAEMTTRVSLARFAEGRMMPTSTNALLSELHRTWARTEAADLAQLYCLVAPNYAAFMESYQGARKAVKQAR